jgi:hypothetical protein
MIFDMWVHDHKMVKILFRKTLIDLEVKGQGSMKVIMVSNTPSYGHAPTYQISLTYLERQKFMDFNYVSPSNEGRYILF